MSGTDPSGVPPTYRALAPPANDCDRKKQARRHCEAPINLGFSCKVLAGHGLICKVPVMVLAVRYQSVTVLANSRAGFRQSKKPLPISTSLSIPCAAFPTGLEHAWC